MKILALTITLVIGFASAVNAEEAAVDTAAGKKLWKKINCAQCHKKDGMGKAKMKEGKWKLNAVKGPRVAGLDAKYIIEQVTAIKTKKRKTKYTISMMAKVKKLSDEDIANIAEYISKELNPKGGSFKGMNEK